MQDLRDYKQIELTLVTDLEKLREQASKHQLAEVSEELAGALERLRSGRFTLAVVGEFKRGKSTLINALLGQDVFPTDVLPTTATLNRLVYSLEQGVELHYRDGRSERIALSQLRDYVTKLDEEAAQRAAQIREAVVYFPCQYCRNNVELIDTPGLQDESAMTDVTMQVLPQVDAAILVISALSPLSESEMLFLEQLGYGQCAKLFIVVGSIDRLNDPQQVDRLLLGLQRRLDRLDDSIKANLHPKLFPVSAYQALQGRTSNNGDLLRASRMQEFEQALEAFLGQERGLAALLVPLQIGLACIEKIRQQVQASVQDWQLRDAALQARKEGLEQPVPAVQPGVIDLSTLDEFVTREAAWKQPLRSRMESLAEEIPKLLQPSSEAPKPAGLFASLKASLDTRSREQLPRELFRLLQASLTEGLELYEKELLKILDREWDDFLDHQEPALSQPAAWDGLQRNRRWVTYLMDELRNRLQLQYRGGFTLPTTWAVRPDLWVLKTAKRLPIPEMRREMEGELIRQLNQDVSDLLRSWRQEVEKGYQDLALQPSPASNTHSQLRDWVRESVLLEKEQSDLRQDWSNLQRIQDRLNPLREKLLSLKNQ